MNRRGSRLVHDRRIFLLALAAGFPGVATALGFLWIADQPAGLRWSLAVGIAGFWLAMSFSLRNRVAAPLRTLANLLEALREGDYSIRARSVRSDDALGEAMRQVNLMSATLRSQRLGALEATALLRKVMEEIEVAVFAFDGEQKLRLVNRAGERLLGETSERLLVRTAAALGLDAYLAGEPHQTLQRAFPGASGRWGISRSTFREGGLPHQLLVVSDLTRPLREEELKAWQRLVRVLGHELNNSLAPIKSIAGSLERLLGRDPRPSDWDEDMRSGLAVIASRSESLSRFMNAYALLARLPPPALGSVEIGPLIQRVAGLETRVNARLTAGPAITLRADGDQLEQLLINLIRNAADASLETGADLEVAWKRQGGQLLICVRDRGHGLANTANLFVPFFTTKPGGSGIGLVLSRQIAEAHGGTLTLRNADDGPGCEALLALPIHGT